jgi:hypothetical protein
MQSNPHNSGFREGVMYNLYDFNTPFSVARKWHAFILVLTILVHFRTLLWLTDYTYGTLGLSTGLYGPVLTVQ